MCGFDIRCAAKQEAEVSGTGSHLLIIWDTVPERATPALHRKSFLQRVEKTPKHFCVCFLGVFLVFCHRRFQDFNCESRQAAKWFILAAAERSHHQGHGPFKYKLCITLMSLTTQ